MSQGPPSTARSSGRALGAAGWALAVLALAVAPSLGTLRAPLISDDTAALGYVHREGPLDDWTGPEYGMRVVRFWRPLVTTSLDLQESWTGTAPLPLRLFNLGGHALAAVLAGLLARRLGAGRAGALCAGALAATFPEQGGTVTWIVGRVDSLSVPLVLLALWLALGEGLGRRGSALAVAFLACATKELAFALPLCGALLALGLPGAPGLRRAAASAFPLALGAGAALLARRAALGVWAGGYPLPGLEPAAVARGLAAVGPLLALPLVAGLCALLLAGPRRAAWRALACGLGAAAASLLPLLPLLATGALQPQNRRILFLADALVAVAAGGALRLAKGRAAWAACAPLLAAAGLRAWQARADTREWAASADLAQAHCDGLRAALAKSEPAEEPVLDPAAPRTHGGAYCLAWGFADRFRAPFPPAPRPIWPRRLMFAQLAPGDRERPPLAPEAGGLIDPFADGAPRAPALPVNVDGAQDFPPLELDFEAARGGGPVLELGAAPGAALEVLVYTELGYELAALPPDPGAAEGPRRISLGEVLRLRGLATLGDALIQAADAGSTRAYLEVREVDPASPHGPPRAASRMVPLRWSDDLLERLGVGE